MRLGAPGSKSRHDPIPFFCENIMTNKSCFRLSLFCALLLVTTCGLQAGTVVVVQDAFSGTNAATLTGRTPDTVDLPGTTYQSFANNSCCAQAAIDTGTGTPSPSADTGFNNATYLNIGSVGSYHLPSEITISGDIQINSIITNDVAAYPRGVGLGFFSGTPNSGEASSTFTGLVVNPDGTLRLVAAGTAGANASTTFLAAPFPGFSASNFYNLSYDVNTTTGVISHIIFNGHDDTAAIAGGTSSVLTPGFLPSGGNLLAGFYGSTSANANFFGRVDNFTISSPEPSTFVLGGLGLVGLLVAARRRRKA
jgi:MYXO-CTERM domain-containing protein